MTTPVLETVRNIPMRIEKEVCDPMSVDADDSGFPFDREDDRDDDLRSQLDDIAKRHPEFAEHLEGFPFRSDSLGRRRPPRPSDEPEFRRFTGRPFGSARFERFGFPFNRDSFEEEFQRGEEPQEAPRPKPEAEVQKPQPQTPERGRRQNIQQSNTVDLGQKQEPVNDRSQRSMSAPPPDNRSAQPRFVSSINIPIGRDGGMGDMGGQQSQPQQEKPTKPTERVIPIHVEGRDEPVLPKHTGPSFSQPQPERIFGHRPSQFTQFVGREPPRTYAAGPEWHHPAYAKQEPAPAETMRQQHVPQQQQVPPQQKQQQQVPPQQKQQQQVPPQQKQQQQQQQQIPPQEPVTPPQAPPQPKSSSSPNPIEIIQLIQKDVSELMGQVEKFAGVPRDKQYLYLDEMLTRNLIKLDNIDTQGQENIRQARKEAIKCIEGCIGILEAKAAANAQEQASQEEKVEVKPEEPQPVEQESQQQPVAEEKMEVEVKEEAKVEAPAEDKMEVIGGPAVLVVQPEVEENAEEQKPGEENKQEEAKPDAEMKEVPEETKAPDADATAPTEVTTNEASQGESQEDSNEDKKEKKKGKKKVVKK